jgi:hypothetical protein
MSFVKPAGTLELSPRSPDYGQWASPTSALAPNRFKDFW